LCGGRNQHKKSPADAGLFTHGILCFVRADAYFEDFFEELLEVDLRADDFEAFLAPLFVLLRAVVDFFAPDLEALDRDFDDFLVAGDFAICGVLSFPSKRARESHLPPWDRNHQRPLSFNRAEMFSKIIHRLFRLERG
jgi:hypothetical protein